VPESFVNIANKIDYLKLDSSLGSAFWINLERIYALIIIRKGERRFA
jgi:hypothetical protein